MNYDSADYEDVHQHHRSVKTCEHSCTARVMNSIGPEGIKIFWSLIVNKHDKKWNIVMHNQWHTTKITEIEVEV